jgi:hypothetical protein
LQAQPSAVLGMLDVLVGHGRLAEIGPDGGNCAACGLQSQCSLLVARRKRYALTPRHGAQRRDMPDAALGSSIVRF